MRDTNKTIGYCYDDTDGEYRRTDISEDGNTIFASARNLTRIEVHEGVTTLYCRFNNLKELHIPDSVDRLACDADLFNYDKCNASLVDIFYEFNPSSFHF